MKRFSICEGCNAAEPPEGPKFKVCGRCRAVRYCSRECQAHDWTASHGKKCGRQFPDAALFSHWLIGIANGVNPTELDRDVVKSLLFRNLSATNWDVDESIGQTARDLICPCLLAQTRYASLPAVIIELARDKPLQCCNAECVFRKAGLARPILCASKADVPCGLSRGHKHVISRWFCCSHCETRGMQVEFR